MWRNPQFPAVTFTKETLNWKLHFFCSDINFDEIWCSIFPHWYNLHDLSACEVFFSSLSQYLIWEVSVNTTLTTMGHFFAKKLNFCPSDIIWNSIALKWQCLKHTSKFLIRVSCVSNRSLREIRSPHLDPGN